MDVTSFELYVKPGPGVGTVTGLKEGSVVVMLDGSVLSTSTPTSVTRHLLNANGQLVQVFCPFFQIYPDARVEIRLKWIFGS